MQVEPTLPRGEVLDVAGFGRMFVRNAGAEDGSLPVVLLHGWTWNADLTFAGLYGPLAEHHRLIAPDVLGHGRSARPEWVWRIEDASAGVIALLDHLGVDRTVWRLLAALWPFARRWRLQTLTARAYADSLRRSDSLRRHWDWAQRELRRMTLRDVLLVADEVRTSDLRNALASPLSCPAEYTVLTRDRLCQPPLQHELARLIGAVENELHGDHDMPMVNPERYADGTVAAIRRIAARALADREAS